MTPSELGELLDQLPRKRLLFLPTPFHKLDNLSSKYGVGMYIKRDDMTGPGAFGGNKTRKIEFILGHALRQGVEYLISIGAYQTNAGMQLTQCCRKCGVKPILYLADLHGEGEPKELRGNLLLSKIMGCEVHYVPRVGSDPGSLDTYNKCLELAEQRKRDLERNGKKAMVLPSGLVSEEGWVSYVLCLMEILDQCRSLGIDLQYLFHTTGTGGSLPGLIAGKLLLGEKAQIVSININSRTRDGREICSPEVICDRTIAVFGRLGVAPPTRAAVFDEIHIDSNYRGVNYGIPSEDGSNAIRELAREEGLLVDPIYSAKGFAGLLSYIRTGRIARGSNVAFVHTGGLGSLFTGPEQIGDICK